MLLAFLDLSAAFDMVKHVTLLNDFLAVLMSQVLLTFESDFT